MKTTLFIILILTSLVLNASVINQPQGKTGKGNYERQADSLRREHLAPRKSDSIEQAKPEAMPVIKPDTEKEQKMPVVKPKNNQHMPTKELSDTLKK